MTNIPASDTLAEVATLVKTQLDWITDEICSNVQDNDDAARIEVALDALSDLATKVVELAARRLDTATYSDGRPIRSRIELNEQNSVFSHLWPSDPALATEQRVELSGHGSHAIVHIVPPSTLRVENVRTLAVTQASEGDA
ncbi:hypothetical protein [Rhodococcus artemisiae]|uniref:Uncharacterized protein n=1 Tax=Rhodococcus artemisiae TaxID=714159 RepID=A0ABU7L9P0_9NOCA|nr:hypothetical protein [Rhodococcus artemisiae]MEE2058269.1 hypothetical protein [Rhodococcus artemisiae]